MLFSLEKNSQNAKVCSIRSDLSMNNDVFQTGYEPSQHGLCADSPSCLVSRSQTACTWQKPPGYMRLAISCLGGRKNTAQEEGVSKNCFSNTEQFRQF